MTEIKKVAVIGSGVMGAGIAAHIANASTEVMLLDIVTDQNNRNLLTSNALAKITAENSPFLAHNSKAKYISIGNLEDDFDKLADMDWIIEVVIEKLEIKQALYQKIDTIRKPGSIVSSNTSTLPLSKLTNGMSSQFAQDFLISHFFNPPRFMRLLELVTGASTNPIQVKILTEFMDIKLGKGIVICKDTPGFIANRIGCFWLETAVAEAIRLNIRVEDADIIMGKQLGFPSTGVFGLIDLIGLDLMPLMAKSLMTSLSADDDFCVNYKQSPVVLKMISDGHLGRKTGSGFYKISKQNGKKIKEVIDLASGNYRMFEPSVTESSNLITSEYAWAVLSKVLNYAAKLHGEIADDIVSIDAAMKLGYNWKFGPFELIDKFQAGTESGPSWFRKKLLEGNVQPAAIIEKIGVGSFYKTEAGKDYYFGGTDYLQIKKNPSKISLKEIKLNPENLLAKNDSASIWDLGDSVYCFEFDSKMNAIDEGSFQMLKKAISLVVNQARALVIASDKDIFSVGANLKYLISLIESENRDSIAEFIKLGQDVLLSLKYAPFPVVSAVKNLAFGGGAEILLASSKVVAYLESNIGLVETSVGLIPGWGGCTELFFRSIQKDPINYTELKNIFSNILNAHKSGTAEYAKSMLLLRPDDQITMNIERVLSDAKQASLALAANYTPPSMWQLQIDASKIRPALEEILANATYSDHDLVIAKHLINIFTGGSEGLVEVDQHLLLQLEREAFISLCNTQESQARIMSILN